MHAPDLGFNRRPVRRNPTLNGKEAPRRNLDSSSGAVPRLGSPLDPRWFPLPRRRILPSPLIVPVYRRKRVPSGRYPSSEASPMARFNPDIAAIPVYGRAQPMLPEDDGEAHRNPPPGLTPIAGTAGSPIFPSWAAWVDRRWRPTSHDAEPSPSSPPSVLRGFHEGIPHLRCTAGRGVPGAPEVKSDVSMSLSGQQAFEESTFPRGVFLSPCRRLTRWLPTPVATRAF